MNINCHTSELVELFSKGINISTLIHNNWNICVGTRGYVVHFGSISNGYEWNFKILQDTVNAINIRISNTVHVDIDMARTGMLEQTKDGKYKFFFTSYEALDNLMFEMQEKGWTEDKQKFTKNLKGDGTEEIFITFIEPKNKTIK